MCGILYTNDPGISKQRFLAAASTMDHRGPDSDGYHEDGRKRFAFRRLAILDLNARSDQPFRSSNLTLIFNGEIYNYKELITEHYLTTHTSSDTEVIVEMYRKYGTQCLDYFNGMFALIIFDSETGDLFTARDRLGIKPLYHYHSGEIDTFSSEMAAMLLLHESEIDEFGVRQYRKLRMTIKRDTLYKDIKMFPPGHYWLNGKLTRYWNLEIHPTEPPEDEHLKWLIEDSVRLRKRADVAVGSFLSGGLDSTILSYILKPEDTWTVGFESLNEFTWGSLANRDLESVHHQIVVNKDQYLDCARWMVAKRKEPLSVPNEVLIYQMTKAVRERNTVVLSGEGADELFFGYDRIFRWANEQDTLRLDEFDQHYSYGSQKDDEVLAYALEDLPGDRVVDKVAYYFQTHHLQGLLRRVDNSTMLCSVEARVPFVDHRLIELMAGTPFDWRMGSSIKQPLKRIFRSMIPKEIIDRKKIGFPVPLAELFDTANSSQTPMDAWLDFNLSLLGDSFGG